MSNNKKLTFTQLLTLSSLLFGMFFGAGNLIFPIHLGQLTCNHCISSFFGFSLTAIGLPILCVIALGLNNINKPYDLKNHINKYYANFLIISMFIIMGPILSMPRCASIPFNMGMAHIVKKEHNAYALFIFTLIFFIACFYLSLNQQNILTYIGKILNPLFLIFLGFFILSALIKPAGDFSTIASSSKNPFVEGMLSGYNTCDILSGFAFVSIIITVLKNLQITKDKDIFKNLVKSSIITSILMGILYIFMIIIGAQSRCVLAFYKNGALAFSKIAYYYYGNAGYIILSTIVTFACLKTCVALSTSCSKVFDNFTGNKLGYKKWILILNITSLIMANIDLTLLLDFSGKYILSIIYPLLIILVVFLLINKIFKLKENKNKIILFYTSLFTAIPLIISLLKTISLDIFNKDYFKGLTYFNKMLPFYNKEMHWILPSIVGLLIGILIYNLKNDTQEISIN